MKKIVLFMLLFAFCLLAADTFSVQGVLRDPLGKTVDDGYYNLLFKLYNSESGGESIWEESQGSVLITNGVFGVELGISSSLDQVPFNENYWIGISVNEGTEMEPRFKLTKSPSSMSVFGTDNVFPSVGNVGVGTHEPVAYLHIVDSEPGVDKLLIESEAGDNAVVVTEGGKVGINVESPEADLHIKATNTTTPKLKIENENGTNQFVVASDGKIGVNLDEPAQALDINGNLKMRNGGIMFDDGSTLTSADMGGSASSVSNFGTTLITADSDENDSGNLDLISGSTTVMRITPTEKVMIDAENVIIDTNGTMTIGEITSGSINTSGSVAASFFISDNYYDQTNSNFYLRPSTTSKLYNLSVGHSNNPVGTLDIREDEVRIWDGSANVNYANGQGDLYVEHDIEADGSIYVGSLHDRDNSYYLVNPASDTKLAQLSLGGTHTSTTALDVREESARIWDGSANIDYATGEGDLYVENDLEVDHTIRSREIYTSYNIGLQNEDYQLDNETGLHFSRSTTDWRLLIDVGWHNFNFKWEDDIVAWINKEDGTWNESPGRGLQRNYEPSSGDLAKIMQLKPLKIQFTDSDNNEKTKIGFKAEEVEEVYPELVSDNNGLKGMNYSGFSVAAIGAIQELNKKVDEQEKTIEMLIKRIEALENK